MYDLMTLDDEDFEFDPFGEEFEDDFEDDDEADELALSAILGAGLGAGAGGLAAGGLYDGSSYLLRKYGGNTGRRFGNWLSSSQRARNFATNTGAGIGGLLGGTLGAVTPAPEADPYEPEYESDAIDDMEALMEIALEGDGEDAEDAVDAMISRAFGPIRAAGQIRQIMGVLRAKVRKLVAMARRNPQVRNAARVAPMALRRTAVKLLKAVSKGRRVTPQLAIRVFAGELAKILKSSGRRRTAVHRHRMRARRRLGSHRHGSRRSRSSRSRRSRYNRAY